ncbi:hypothetical protein BDN72DRAFT_962002 [Pluteus cervinus]|uniref:Uncharacterized protein n=1 Tax=Pluteus cervinus TaxID=181527 RepID=A0ACD3AKJ2_9AGAR|nr:hypothetical protein BDN72DRAFT_962002 [Pluteus cervinus]
MRPSLVIHTPESREVAIQKLDQEIQSLNERICLLKAQRNTFSITYTLPAETVGEIFAIVQAKCKYNVMSWSTDEPFATLQQWLPITHVSQRWRKVALECSQLWCEIDALPEPAISTFLARSRGRNLVVSITPRLRFGRRWYTYSAPLRAEVIAELPGIQQLSAMDERTISSILPCLISAPAPKLETLRISGPFEGGFLPANIFRGITPPLRSLTLCRCLFNPNILLFTDSLTVLEVLYCPIGSARVWPGILQQLPHLSALILRSSFTDTEYIPIPEDVGDVPLLQLALLDITGSLFETDLDFLSHLTFPSQTKLSFASSVQQSEDEDDDNPPTPPLITFLRTHHKVRRDMSKMGITGVQWRDACDELYTNPSLGDAVIFSLEDGGSLPHYLDVRLEGVHTAPCDRAHMTEITSLPVSLATSFTMDGEVDKEGLQILSDRFPNLQEISCSGSSMTQLLLALGVSITDFVFSEGGLVNDVGAYYDDVDEMGGTQGHRGGEVDVEDLEEVTQGSPLLADPDSSSSESCKLFPSLKSLNFYRTSLHTFEDALARALLLRRDNGVPIKEIQFTLCTQVQDAFVSRLRGLVDEVRCVQCNVEEPDYDDEPYYGHDMGEGSEGEY